MADPYEPTQEEIDQLLAEFGGDHRAAISALLHDVAVLGADCEVAVTSISFGYSRGLWSLGRKV